MATRQRFVQSKLFALINILLLIVSSTLLVLFIMQLLSFIGAAWQDASRLRVDATTRSLLKLMLAWFFSTSASQALFMLSISQQQALTAKARARWIGWLLVVYPIANAVYWWRYEAPRLFTSKR